MKNNKLFTSITIYLIILPIIIAQVSVKKILLDPTNENQVIQATNTSNNSVNLSTSTTPNLLTNLPISNSNNLNTTTAITLSTNTTLIKNSSTIPTTTSITTLVTTNSPIISTLVTTNLPTISTTTSTTTTQKPKGKLRILALMDFFSDGDYNTYDSAATVAVRLIDANPDILPNHVIDLVRKDPGGQTGIPYQHIYKTLVSEERIHAVVGPGDSGAVQLSSELLTNYALMQVSFAALDPTLGSRKNKPYLFRSNPSLESYTSSVIALFKRNNWKKAAILYDFTNAILLRTALNLQQLLTKEGIDPVIFERIDKDQLENDVDRSPPRWDNHYQDLVSKVKKIKDADIRTIIAVFNPPIATHVFCEAYKHQMYGKRYVWLVPNGNSYLAWTDGTRALNNCTNKNLKESSYGMMLFRTGPKRIDGVVTVANKTANEIWDLVREQKLSVCKRAPCRQILNALYVYDAIWALAIAFDKAEKELANFSMENYTYFDHTTTKQLAGIMDRLEFEGVSGFYSYTDQTGDNRARTAEMVLTQYNGNSPYTNESIYKDYGVIGFSGGKNGEIKINETFQRLVIPNYTVPLDGPILLFPAEQFPIAVIVFTWSFSIGGIIVAVVFLYVNIRYRDKLLIKMSSPNINNAIIVGCICCYISVILYGLDSRTLDTDQIPLACNATMVFLIIGFTLAFGSLFSKTWRIYRIFTTARTLRKTGIRDIHLFAVVLVMLFVDIVIIILWLLVSPFELRTQLLDVEVDGDLDKITTPIIHRCSCLYDVQFTAATYAYKGLLMVFGLFVAWETKRIKVTVLNDSKYIGVSVYIVALFSSIAAVVTHSLSNTTSFEASYVIFAICICTCTSVTLCFVFVPKVILLVQNFEDPNFKNGRPVLDGEAIGVYNSGNSSDFAQSMSDIDTRSDNYHKIRHNTTATQSSNVTDLSIGDVPLSIVPEHRLMEDPVPSFRYRNGIGSFSSDTSNETQKAIRKNRSISFVNPNSNSPNGSKNSVESLPPGYDEVLSKSFPSIVNNNDSVFMASNGSFNQNRTNGLQNNAFRNLEG